METVQYTNYSIFVIICYYLLLYNSITNNTYKLFAFVENMKVRDISIFRFSYTDTYIITNVSIYNPNCNSYSLQNLVNKIFHATSAISITLAEV